MKVGAVVAGLALAAFHHVAGQSLPPGAETVPKCTSISVRKEIRTLTSVEWSTYTNAVEKAVSDGWINWFGFLHQKIEKGIHANAQFFLAHRNLMADYETILRGYDPNVVLPYWNTGMDFQNPTASPVLTDRFLGGNGTANGGCVADGLGKGWAFTYPKRQCLRRKYGESRSISRWYPPEFVTSILQTSKTHNEIRMGIENSLHGVVHLSVGGNMNTMYSPTDAIFWPHHGNIDRLYSQWQAADHATRDFMYDGVNRDGSPATLNDTIAYTFTRAYELMRLGYGKLCYTYDTIQEANGDVGTLLSKNLDTRGAPAVAGKCRHRDSSPAKPVSAETQTLQGLSRAVVQKHFPGLAGKANPMESDMRSPSSLHPPSAGGDAYVAVPVPNEALRGKMEYPMTLTDDFINMMHLCPEEVRALEARARKLVDDLNAENYLSPYMT